MLTVESLRRYPVKAMGGEPLTSVEIDERGVAGDRWFAVVDAAGRLGSAKTTRRLRRLDPVLAHTATTTGRGVRVQAGGETWAAGEAALDAHLSRLCEMPVAVRPEEGASHQDDGALSLVGSASLDWCARRWGVAADPRRLRVNIVVATDEPFVEETWDEVAVGGALLRVAQRIERCRTVDVAQDGADITGRLLRPLAAERDMRLAVYLDVLAPGTVSVGDRVVPR